jgi:peptide-methionine (R)-S-oxide reductase
MLRWKDILDHVEHGNAPPKRRVERSNDEWRTLLSPEVYAITRAKGTERPFSSEMCAHFEPGIYQCACCGTDLFDAKSKFDSGTGWPSFTEPIASNVVAYHDDRSYGMVRVETTCAVCDAHLGHVFPDGPAEAGGLRFCINALALKKRDP